MDIHRVMHILGFDVDFGWIVLALGVCDFEGECDGEERKGGLAGPPQKRLLEEK
jgi:hypothetical protein